MNAPRPLPPQQTRYPVRLVAECCRLYAGGAGLTPTQIRDHIAINHDCPLPTLGTVRRWVIPSEADYQRELNRAAARRRRERGGQPMLKSGRLEGEEAIDRMYELWEHKLPYSAIAEVMKLYHGSTLSPGQIRARLQKRGAKPMPAKVIAMRRNWMRKRAEQEQVDAAA